MINKEDIPYKYRAYKDRQQMIDNAHRDVDNYVNNQIPGHINRIGPSDTDILLDIGSGPGLLAKAVSPLVQKVYCCDINNQYLSFAKETCDGLNNMSFHLVEDLKLPLSFLPNNTITKAYATSVFIHNCTEMIINYLHELNRVLKPGGTFFTRYCTKNTNRDKYPDWIDSDKKAIDSTIKSLGFREIVNNEFVEKHWLSNVVVKLKIEKDASIS
jgi:ubiquinone/menaquinone biosynthesis C-methylase UbiE